MSRHLAVYNFNMFRLHSGDPANDGFHARNDLNFATAEASDGFVARSGYEGEPGPESWGLQVYPRFYVETGEQSAPSSLSLWEDIPALLAFTYGRVHADAVRNGRLWFEKQVWPPYVLWWVRSDRRPDWTEAARRLEHLHDHGPSPEAFDFKHPFDPNGLRTAIDSQAVSERRARNERLLASSRAL